MLEQVTTFEETKNRLEVKDDVYVTTKVSFKRFILYFVT